MAERKMMERLREIAPAMMADADKCAQEWAAEVGMTPEQWARHWRVVIHVHYDCEGMPYEYLVAGQRRATASDAN